MKNRIASFFTAGCAAALLFAVSGIFFPMKSQAASESARQIEISAYIVNTENEEITNGEYDIQFSIYSSDRTDPEQSEGAAIWRESQQIEIKNGILSVYLGEENPLPNSLSFLNGTYYLGVKIGSDSEMIPRKRIGTVSSAIEAINAESLSGAVIGSEEGDIPVLGSGGKISLEQLPTGTDENSIILGDDERLHEQGTDLGTDSKTFNIGSGVGLSGNNFDITASSASNKPTLRFNGLTQSWQYSNDGNIFTNFDFDAGGNFLSLSGGTMTGDISFSSTQNFGGATLTELNYLSGATSNIQNQIDNHAHSTTDITSGTFGVGRGGTGLATIPSGSLLFSESADSISAFSGAAGDDGEFLRFNWNGGSPTLSWDVVTGSFTSFTVAGDSGTNQMISDGNILTIAGGTGIETLVGATDTITVSITDDSIGDTQLLYNTGQHLTSTSSPAFAGLSITGASGAAYFSAGALTSEAQLGVGRGGTGINGAAAAQGTLLIGNGTGYTLATLTSGAGISISNGAGTITIASALGTSIDTAEIVDGTIAEVDLNVTNAPTDNYVLTYNQAGGNFTWESISGVGSITALTLNADSGTPESLGDGDTIVIAGGTAIETSVGITDTVTVSITDDAIGDTQLLYNTGQHLTSTSSPAFAGLSITGASGAAYFSAGAITSEAQLGVSRGGTGVNGSTAANGTLLIGNGTGYTLATLTDGAGITVTEGAGTITIAAALGTSIDTTEITDGTIAEVDLNATNAPTGGYILAYDATSGGFTWIANTGGTGSSKWTDAGTLTYLTETADDVALGGTSSLSPFFFDVSASAFSINPYGAAAGNTGEIRFKELADNGSDYVGFKAPDAIGAGGKIWTLPASDGSASNVLVTDGSGNLSWSSVSGVGGITGSGTNGYITYWTGTDSLGAEQYLAHERGGLEADVSAADGIVKISGGATSFITDNSANWNTAYGWGNHASVGYITASSVDTLTNKSGNISMWTNDANYITLSGLSSTATGLTYTNTTGVFSLTSGYVIPTTTEQSNWNTAYGWGDHALEGYITDGNTNWDNSYGFITSADDTVSGTELDGVFSTTGLLRRTGVGTYDTITDSSANWNTAYGWGDHAGLYDATGTAATAVSTHESTYNHANYNTAYGWGDHASVGYITASSTNTLTNKSGNISMWTNDANYITLSGLSSTATGLTYTNTTGVFSLTTGYVIPTTTQETNWTTAYTNRITSATSPLAIATNNISMTQATALVDGYLSASDWDTFNSKQDTIGVSGSLLDLTGATLSVKEGTLTDGRICTYSTTSGLICNTDSGTVGHSSLSIGVPANGLAVDGSQVLTLALASGSTTGALSSTDWTTFNAKQNALTIGNLSGTADQVSVSGGTGAIIGSGVTLSLPQSIATTSSPTFGGLTLTGLSGVLKATAGLISGSATTTDLTEGTNLYFTDARARSAISSTVTGLTYTSATGVLSLTSGYVIPTTTEQSNWNTAYGWGDHAGLYDAAGTAATAVSTHESTYNHANYNTAYGWGDHASVGYITASSTNTLTNKSGNISMWTNDANYITLSGLSSTATGLTYTNTTGVFSLTSGYVIPTTTQETNWNTAYGWGDHALEGYITDGNTNWDNSYGFITSADDTVSGTELDGVFSTTGLLRRTGVGTYDTITDSSANWNTAYGWGDHAGLYDATGTAATAVSTHESTYNHANYNTAYGWGDHASVGYITASSTNTLTNKSGNISMWTNDANYITLSGLSSTATGLTYTNTTGVFSLTSGYVIPTTTQETNWTTAYNWGDHSSAGYFTLPSLTSGSILFSNGTTIAQDNDNFFWNNTTKRLGLGTASPSARLEVNNGTFLVNNPANPTLAGTYNTSGAADEVYVSGKYVYVADSLSGLQIIDISNPNSPTLTGTYNTSGNAQGVHVSGKYAYIADLSSGGIQIVDISNPTSPSLAGNYDTSGGANSVYVSGRYAYVADTNSGLQIIDISNPASPTLTGNYIDAGSYALDVYVSGKYAYLANGDGGLTIVDVSTPATPTLAGNYDTGDFVSGVYVSGKYAYLTNGETILIINVSNPASPTLAGTYNGGSYGQIYVSGKYAYVADGIGLKILDVSNPASPTLAGSYNTSGNAYGIYVSGKYAYVGDGSAGLQIIDILGANIYAAHIGNIGSQNITVTENIDVGNNLYVRSGLNVGQGGILTDGMLSVSGASYFGGNIGIGTTSPTARLHLPAGTATAGTAPLKLTSGTNLTAPEAGAIEFDGTDLFFTPDSTRETIAFMSDISGAAHDAVTLGTANGLSLDGQVLSLALASGSATGALSSTDWTTFNNKFTLPSLTSGSILFSDGTTISQDNSNFFWDDTNKYLGIGTASPNAGLTLEGGILSLKEGYLDPTVTSGYGKIYAKVDTSEDTVDSYTKLLIHSNTTDGDTVFEDSSSSAHSITPTGNVHHETDEKKFGLSSIRFDGSGDYLTIPSSTNFDFGSADFTIDLWVNLAQIGKNQRLIARHNGTSGWYLNVDNTNTVSWHDSDNINLYSTTTLTTGTWHHIAVVINNGIQTLYIDGIEEASDSFSASHDSTLNVQLGRLGVQSSYDLNGYLDEVRVSKGIARWTTNFTPPNSAYSETSKGLFYKNDLGIILNIGSPWITSTNGSDVFVDAENVGIRTTLPGAYLHLGAGTATAGTAPLKLTAGTNLTTPEAGAIEFDGTYLYYTDSTDTRQTINTGSSHDAVTLTNSPATYDYLTISGQAITLNQIDLTTDVTGILPAANGGTGLDTSASTGIPTISSGTWTIASSLGVTLGGTGTTTQFDQGSIVFAGASGAYSQDNSNFFWDSNNYRLGIGTNSPSDMLDIFGVGNGLRFSYDLTNFATLSANSSGELVVNSSSSGSSAMTIGGGAVEDTLIIFDGNAQDYHIGLDDTDDTFKIGLGEALGTTDYLTINSSGNIGIGGHILPGTDNTYDLGSASYRFRDLYLGGTTLHIGTSATDEGTFSYDTTSNIFSFGTDSTTNGDIAFFTDDLYLDKSSGYVGIGTVSPNNSLEILGTTAPQIRVAYDASNYVTTSVSSSGAVTLDATGASAGFTLSDSLTIGGDILPATSGVQSLGTSTNRFNELYLGSSLHLGEDGDEASIDYDSGTGQIIFNTAIASFAISGGLNISSSDLNNSYIGDTTDEDFDAGTLSANIETVGVGDAGSVQIGSDYGSIWTQVSADWLPVDVGTNATPTFADIDNDTANGNDYDLAVGDGSGLVEYFQNTGSASSPTWSSVSTDWLPVGVGTNAKPTFAKIDSDDDYDLAVGDADGLVEYFRNDGDASSPTWTSVSTDWLNPIDVGTNAAPTFVDINGDGIYDLAVGDGDGYVEYFRNDGTANTPAWTHVTDNWLPVDVGDNAVPTFADIDSDGDFDLAVGDATGNVEYFRNDGDASSPTWTHVSADWLPASVGTNAAPAFVDIDDDGDSDLAVGDADGLVEYFENEMVYFASGDLTSRALYNSRDTPDYTTIAWTETVPAGTDIQIQLRSASTEAGLAAATWYGPTGTGDYYTTSAGENMNAIHDGDNWIQYKAFFTSDTSARPVLSDVSINFEYYSKVIIDDAGNFGLGTIPTEFFDLAGNFKVNQVGEVTTGTWKGDAVGAAYGGLGLDTSSATGVPTVSSGIWSVSSSLGTGFGGTGTATTFTKGSLVFAGTNGAYAQNNAKLFWDNNAYALGIGTADPSDVLDIFGTNNALRLSYNASYYGRLYTDSSGILNILGTGGVSIGSAGSDVIIGDIGTAADLVFEESSVISGQGANTITFGESGDTFNLNVSGVSYNFGTISTVSGDLAISPTSGQVGIGMSAPTAMLHVTGAAGTVGFELNSNETTGTNNILMLRSDVASADDAVFRVQANGAVYADGAYTGTGADYAEYFKTKDETLVPGEAVCIDLSQSDSVKRCDRNGDDDIIGIVSTKPSVIGNGGEDEFGVDKASSKSYVIVGLIGQVPAKVSAEALEISIGDSLTADSRQGYLRKALAGESTVGIALENRQSGTGEIRVLISRRNKSLTVEMVEQEVVDRISAMEIEDEMKLALEEQITAFDEQLLAMQSAIAQNSASILDSSALLAEIYSQLELIKDQNKAIIDFATSLSLDSLIYKDAFGNLDLLGGKLIAERVETGGILISVIDPEAKTIGKTVIEKVEVDEDGDGIDDNTGFDGTKVEVETKAVKENSKIFTSFENNPGGHSWVEKKIVDGEYLGFSIILSSPASEDINVSWWIVEEGEELTLDNQIQ